MTEAFGSDGGSFGSEGGSDSGTIGSGSVESAGYTTPGATADQSSSNGAWKELLDVVPREFHPVITPHLQKWDSNYGQLAQQFAPWKKAFADSGQTPEDLVAARQLYDLVNNNPQLVYQRLAQHLEQIGAVPQDYRQQQNGNQQQQEPNTPEYAIESTDEFDDPRLTQMYQQMQQMNQYLAFQQQQAQEYQAAAAQQQMTSDYERVMDQGIRQIMAKDPNVDVNDLLQRTMAHIAQGNEPDIARAYSEQTAFVQRVRAMPMNSANAPRVMPTGGGMPPTIDTSRPRNDAERVNRVQQLLQAAQP
jgi:hypothetical protein